MTKAATDIFHFYNSEYLCSIDMPCQTSAKNIQCYGSGEEVDFVIYAILVTAVILDTRPDHNLQFRDPRVRSCSM